MFHDFYTIKMIRFLVMKPQYIYEWFLYGKNDLMSNKQVGMIINACNVLKRMHKSALEYPNDYENNDCELINLTDYFEPQIMVLFKLIIFLSSHQQYDDKFGKLIRNISKNCEYSICFMDFLFKYYEKLSTNYDEINLDQMHNLIDLFQYLLAFNKSITKNTKNYD